MLRLLFLCALVLLGVGLTMELSTPLRSAVAVVNPLPRRPQAFPILLMRWRRLIDLKLPLRAARRQRSLLWSTERISSSEGISIGSSKPTRVINRHRTEPESKRLAIAARPKSKPKATDIKRTTISERKGTKNPSLVG